MSQTGAERRVKQALINSDSLSPEDSANTAGCKKLKNCATPGWHISLRIYSRQYKAQQRSGATYVAAPVELVKHHGITQGSELDRAYHAESSTLLISLDVSSLFNL